MQSENETKQKTQLKSTFLLDSTTVKHYDFAINETICQKHVFFNSFKLDFVDFKTRISTVFFCLNVFIYKFNFYLFFDCFLAKCFFSLILLVSPYSFIFLSSHRNFNLSVIFFIKSMNITDSKHFQQFSSIFIIESIKITNLQF